MNSAYVKLSWCNVIILLCANVLPYYVYCDMQVRKSNFFLFQALCVKCISSAERGGGGGGGGLRLYSQSIGIVEFIYGENFISTPSVTASAPPVSVTLQFHQIVWGCLC